MPKILMMKNNKVRWIAAILLSILFGSTYSILSKFLLQWTIPETVILVSQIFAVIAAVVFFGLFPEIKNIYKFPNKKLLIMSIVAIFSWVLAPLLYMKWLSETLATNAIVTARMSAIFMWMIGFSRLGEKISRQRVVGTIIMFFGIIYITTQWFSAGFSVDRWVILVCISALASAIGNSIFRKYLQDIDVELAIFIRNGLGAIVFLFAVPRLFGIDHNISLWLHGDTRMYFLALALIPVFFAQYLWYNGLQHTKVSIAWSLRLLSPLFGIMLAYVFLSEPLGRYHLIWAICLIWGVLVTMMNKTPWEMTENTKDTKKSMLMFTRKWVS